MDDLGEVTLRLGKKKNIDIEELFIHNGKGYVVCFRTFNPRGRVVYTLNTVSTTGPNYYAFITFQNIQYPPLAESSSYIQSIKDMSKFLGSLFVLKNTIDFVKYLNGEKVDYLNIKF